MSQRCEEDTDVRFGHDDAADMRLVLRPQPTVTLIKEEAAWVKSSDRPRENGDDFLPVPMPVSSNGPTTFAYQSALQNRLRYDKLTPHGEYDMDVYKPTFLHDCMMQPGSLANLIGKV